MDSTEERLAIAARKVKEQEATEEAKRRQADITRTRKEKEATLRAGGRKGSPILEAMRSKPKDSTMSSTDAQPHLVSSLPPRRVSESASHA